MTRNAVQHRYIYIYIRACGLCGACARLCGVYKSSIVIDSHRTTDNFIKMQLFETIDFYVNAVAAAFGLLIIQNLMSFCSPSFMWCFIFKCIVVGRARDRQPQMKS